MGGSKNGWGAAKMGGGTLKRMGGSKNGWGQAKTGG